MPNDADSIQLILTDIEGTTSSIAFVQEVLFPYSAKHLSDFVRQHIDDTAIQQQLKAAAAIVKDEGGQVDATDITAMTDILLGWLQQDRKATPLKALQGMIWEAGYRQGDYQAHMYPDATECLRRWHEQDVPLYVYSSGSVRAQELFFGFSQDGDRCRCLAGTLIPALAPNKLRRRIRRFWNACSNSMRFRPATCCSCRILKLSWTPLSMPVCRPAGWFETLRPKPGIAATR